MTALSLSLWLATAIALDKAQLVVCAPSYGNRYCGMGTIDGVLARDIEAPMAYRVLVPWLVGLVERIAPTMKRHRLSVYEALKIALMALCLTSIAYAVGPITALVFASLLPITFRFDYWDWAVEAGALALAIGGHLQAAVFGGIALALSRETAPLVALTYLLSTRDWYGTALIATATALTMLFVHLRQGQHKLYCDRFMWKRNLNDLRQLLCLSPWFLSSPFLSVGVTVLAVAALPFVGPTWPIPLALLALGWTMGIAGETRIFTGCLVWVSMGLAGAIR